MKRKLLISLALASALCAGAGLVGCERTPQNISEPSFEEVFASAQQLGYTGTYEEFVSLLEKGAVGEDGKDGVDGQDGKDGENGKDGVDGKDGENGKDGVDGQDGKDGVDGKDGLNGKDGADGQDGKDGVDGKNGADGVGVKSVEIDENGHLIITLTNGEKIDAGLLDPDVVPEGATKGLAYIEDGTQKGYLVRGMGSAAERKIVIPKTYRGLPVTGIGEGAFEGEVYLKSVTLPESIHRIEARAFRGCKSLNTIEMGEIVFFGDSAFEGCGQLTSGVKISENVSYLGEHAFDGCENLKMGVHFPKNEERINGYVFANCKSLTGTLTLPAQVKYIGDSAFESCGFTGELKLPQSVSHIGDKAFFDTKFTGELDLSDNVTSVGELAFSGAKISSVKVGTGIQTLAKGVFQCCNNLQNVTLDKSLLEIGESAFNSCGELKTVEWGGEESASAWYQIKERAFYGCQNLTKIDFPKGINEIGKMAFMECSALKLTKIPGSIKTLGESAFARCDAIEKIEIGVEKIPQGAFAQCKSLKEVTIGKTVTEIGRAAFGTCPLLGKMTFEDPDNWQTDSGESVTFGSDPSQNATQYQLNATYILYKKK